MNHENSKQDQSSENVSLWRYMKLSTFLLLILEGKAFIPTLETLRKIDPHEGELGCSSALRADPLLAEASKWLENKKNQFEKDQCKKNPQLLNFILQDIWLRELGKRRCVWSWYKRGCESMALWKLYAEQGVLIKTDVTSLCDAISNCKLSYCHDSIRYIRSLEQCRESELRFKPYFLKHEAYTFEEEYRLVVKVSESDLPGIIVSVDAAKLIKHVTFSPFIHSQEISALKNLTSTQLKNENVVKESDTYTQQQLIDYCGLQTLFMQSVPAQVEQGLPKLFEEF